MAKFLQGSFMMGPLLRQHFHIFETQGDEAATKWAESLPERKQQQLAQEMTFYMADTAGQEAATVMREAIEKMSGRLGFTIN